MFTLRIKNLSASTVLGIYEWEQQARRLVILNIEMQVADTGAGRSDAIADAVDYSIIENRVLEHLDRHSYQLLERLVTDVAYYILALDSRIAKVRVEADKPGALRMASSVSVSAEITQS